MKTKNYLNLLITFVFIIFVSCENGNNKHCINTVKNSHGTVTLSESEMNVIKYLFNLNQLDYTKYLFTDFQKDGLEHHVRCYQFANNLMVFTSDAIFHFDENNNYCFLSGSLVGKINLDTKPLMKKDNVVEKFIEIAMHEENLTDCCFDVEFGYYDLNASIGYTSENFTKAWKINPKGRKYPYAYINDKNSELIYYDNGIWF